MAIRTRLLLGLVAVVAVVAAATLVLAERTLGRDLEHELDERLRQQATGVIRWLGNAGHPGRLARRLGGVVDARVTIVGADGVIEGDSERPADVGLAVGRAPEIEAARRTGLGRAIRKLAPDGRQAYLVAMPATDGRVIRLAVPMRQVEATRAALRWRLALAAVVGLVVALGLGAVLIRAIVVPVRTMTAAAARVARGDYAIGPAAESGDELGVLSRALVGLADEVQAQVGALTRERDRSLAVIGAMVEAVIVVDRAGAVSLTNPAADRLGLTPPPPPIAAALTAAGAGRGVDDEIGWAGRTLQLSARPLPGGEGAVCVIHDVSRLRALEVVRREFLANAAHELRTPVTAIAGFADALGDDALDPASRREFVATIERNAARIARLVNDLLALERLDARAETVEAGEPIALAPVVAACAATAAAARAGAAPATIAIAPELTVRGDRDRLEHVIQNLLDNAHKHGGAPIAVTAEVAGDRVRLRVEDGGPGVPAALRERVFERFFRGPAATRGDGSGLGLAIARAAAAALGGTLTLEPSEVGARFVLELPRG
ncbi:MAG: HAMP domain-containing protein [Kofleriaceae bacterium]|nr:HAMP domain-containing protein [Kofleriaceae bacterium]MBP9168943.1 HAMP domain-containing protein [Kofleriaceae bacterium]MBP9859652.1 HAMP domain-containing protein [Kofleriaceae bacterium]